MPHFGQAPDNYQQKCLCVLLLDVSGSMMKDNKLGLLNEAVRKLYDDIVNAKNGIAPSTKDQLFVEVISFDQSPHRIQPYMLLSKSTMPPVLKSRGSTTDTARAIDFAMEEIETHKKMLLSTGQKYYRPWLVLVTDGNPTSSKEQMERISKKIRVALANKHLFMTAVGVGNQINISLLNRLSGGNATKLEGFSFSKFFELLAQSTDKVFKSDDDFDRAMDAEDGFL